VGYVEKGGKLGENIKKPFRIEVEKMKDTGT
jgi:hypothetical protein